MEIIYTKGKDTRNIPMRDPHWLAGTIKRIGICVLPPDVPFSLNCEHHYENWINQTYINTLYEFITNG